MIVGIDGNEANVKNKVGVHKMAYEILWGLYKLEDKKKWGNQFVIYLKSKPGVDLPTEKPFWKYKILEGGRVWILTRLVPELLFGQKPDVFLTPSHYIPPITSIPIVCMVTDLGYLKFSEQFKKYDYWQLKFWTAISIKISKYIIAISESTKENIVRHYPWALKKIKVVLLAGDRKYYNSKISKNLVRQVLEKYRIKKNYILFMSTLKPSKNVVGLLEAFRKVRDSFNLQLVLVGRKGWFFEDIFKKVSKLKLENDVVFTDYLPDSERAALLAGAKLF